MFLQEGPHGTMVLYIPSVFISYNGECLDEKSVLLRSSSIISKTALEILHLIEPNSEGKDSQKKSVCAWWCQMHGCTM
jgi:glutamine synthetase